MNICEYQIHFIHSSRIIRRIRIFEYLWSIRECYIINIRRMRISISSRWRIFVFANVYLCNTLIAPPASTLWELFPELFPLTDTEPNPAYNNLYWPLDMQEANTAKKKKSDPGTVAESTLLKHRFQDLFDLVCLASPWQKIKTLQTVSLPFKPTCCN